MAAVVAQSLIKETTHTITLTALTGTADTFTPNKTVSQLLMLVNDTVSPIVVTMIGDGAPATFKAQGFPAETVDPLSVTVPANAQVTQYINTLSGLLAGVVTITGGTGLSAALINLS